MMHSTSRLNTRSTERLSEEIRQPRSRSRGREGVPTAHVSPQQLRTIPSRQENSSVWQEPRARRVDDEMRRSSSQNRLLDDGYDSSGQYSSSAGSLFRRYQERPGREDYNTQVSFFDL